MSPHLQSRLRTGARAAFNAVWLKNIVPRRKRLPSVWAREERKFAAGQSPLSRGQVIPYRNEIMPHCDEPMDAADDPTVNKTVLWFAIREGKTLGICANIIGRTVTDDPGNIYSVHPIDDDVHKFSTDDIEPMIDACLKGYFVEKKSRESGRTVDHKRFTGGSLRIVSARSITKFRGTSVKVLLLHEVDALMVESIYKALGRTKGFSDAIIVMESTGTLAPTKDKDGKTIYRSKIHEEFDQGDKRKWFCACQECGHLQWLKFEQIKHPPGDMAAARYHCEACDHPHDEPAWKQMALNGKWYPTAGLTDEELRDIAANYHKAKAINPLVRSYWRNGFTSMLPAGKGYATKLHEFVAEGANAQTSREALKTWTNEIKAELWNPDEESEQPPEWKPIFDRREDYGLIIPQRASLLTAAVDCQLNRLEVMWGAWGRGEEFWGMDHVVIDGAVRHPEVWKKLRVELARKWDHESGARVPLAMSLVDGGHYGEDVYRFFQNLAKEPVEGVSGHCRASKGFGRHGHPIIDQRMQTVSKMLKGHHIGTWEAKDRIYARIRMTAEDEKARKEGKQIDQERPVIHLNLRFSEQACQQLVAEKVKTTFLNGEEIRKYENEDDARNEILDLKVGNLAALRLRPRNWDALEAEIRESAEARKEGAKPKPAPVRARGRSSFVSSW